MFAYVCGCSVVHVHMFARLLFLCIWVCAVRQVEGQVLMPAISSFLLPFPRELVSDVLLTITPQSFLTSPPFVCLFILHLLI